MHRLILEFLSAREISPAALVRLAARNRVPAVSICISPFKAFSGIEVPFGDLIDWDIVNDTPNRRELKRICDGNGIHIASADAVILSSCDEIEGALPALESAAWLGAEGITLIPLASDANALCDLVQRFCEMAATLHLTVLLEHSPRMTLKTLREALSLRRSIRAPNLRVIIDSLHFFRGDNSLLDLEDLQPGELARVQLCDAPSVIPSEGGGYEAFYERMIPGDGDLPLAALLHACPTNVDIGMECPLWRLQSEGVEAGERISRIVNATRKILEVSLSMQ